ncbi:RIP metalloprotease RseP [Dehalococcoides mccartyi]|uniref:Zinc metalloprotease n=1 Tax=Dehalococcoides mccartyi (strain VS) TaxID=311424 RepID=D2BGM3_DEHMV|nr:RIP metalloprotease RseP [Dehalococcoides mccartyi]ACZ61473.1 membrane-associated zinc metalloprotease [Dehalococcoides mccartyi VS]
MLLTIVSFLIIFSIVVISHELGHFFSAKAIGVKVEEFGFGYPPKIFGRKFGQTEYTLNWLPLGGFVKVEDDPVNNKGLSSKSSGKRLLFFSAGALVNAVLPIVLFAFALIIPHDVLVGRVNVEEVVPDSPAALAGLVAGDTILSVNGNEIRNTAEFSRMSQLNLGQTIEITVLHADQTQSTVSLSPRWQPPAGEGPVGISLQTLNYQIISESESVLDSIPLSIKQNFETLVLFKNSILGLIMGSVPFDVVGPVGLAQMTGAVARAGVGPLLEFTAFLSLNLAIINLLPLPALDGGRIFFVFIEWIRGGRRISPKVENLIHMIGFFLLIGLMLAVTFQDIVRIASN